MDEQRTRGFLTSASLNAENKIDMDSFTNSYGQGCTWMGTITNTVAATAPGRSESAPLLSMSTNRLISRYAVLTLGTPSMKTGNELTNRDICLYALVKSGGDVDFITTEDIAMEAFELYPERFGLIRHSEHPDVDSVRVTLTDLRKGKYGSLVQGSKKQGWRATDAGNTWFKQNSERVFKSIKRKLPGEKRISSGVMIKNEKVRSFRLARILESGAYVKWRKGEQPNIYDFYDLLRVDSYTPKNVYEDHLKDLISAAEGNDHLRSFLRTLADSYGENYRRNV